MAEAPDLRPSSDDKGNGVNRYLLFECLSAELVKRLTAKDATDKQKKSRRRRSKVAESSSEGLSSQYISEREVLEEHGEFIEYLASEVFENLDPKLQNLSYAETRRDEAIESKYSSPLSIDTLDEILILVPESVINSLKLYGFHEPRNVLTCTLNNYITAASEKPPEHQTEKRATECELCDRDWVPLTYHHLIPKQAAPKAVKRGWCEEWETNKVAWLCRACHNFVHAIASNEELAKNWNSVEALREREDTQKWVKWVSRVRWKSR